MQCNSAHFPTTIEVLPQSSTPSLSLDILATVLNSLTQFGHSCHSPQLPHSVRTFLPQSSTPSLSLARDSVTHTEIVAMHAGYIGWILIIFGKLRILETFLVKETTTTRASLLCASTAPCIYCIRIIVCLKKYSKNPRPACN